MYKVMLHSILKCIILMIIIHLVHGLKFNMKNKLMPKWNKIMQRKRYIIECINELLKNKTNLVHSRHRSIHNYIMNLYSFRILFFDNKPDALVKTEDIHPPKTGISVHFCVLSLMAMQN